jgi:hypothetical protein
VAWCNSQTLPLYACVDSQEVVSEMSRSSSFRIGVRGNGPLCPAVRACHSKAAKLPATSGHGGDPCRAAGALSLTW